jgi:hypothetical protein
MEPEGSLQIAQEFPVLESATVDHVQLYNGRIDNALKYHHTILQYLSGGHYVTTG